MPKLKRLFKRRWRAILTVITFVALGGLVYALRDQIMTTLRNIENLNLWLLLLIIPLQAGHYHFVALMYRSLFKSLGRKVSYRFLYKTGLELNFVNLVFPSAGVSGFSYFGIRMKNAGVGAGKSTLVQTMRFVLIFLSFQVLLFMGLFVLALDGRASGFMILVAGSLATLLAVGTVALSFIIGKESRINAFLTFVTRQINRLLRLFRSSKRDTINVQRAKKVFSEYHESYVRLRRNRRQLRQPLMYALGISFMEVLTVYAVFAAFDQWVNPGAVIIAYAVANFSGLISVLPGGIGVYEALMTGVLAAGGVSPAVSIPIVVTYRITSMLVQLPPGGYLYSRSVHEGNT